MPLCWISYIRSQVPKPPTAPSLRKCCHVSLEAANRVTDFLYLARFVGQALHEPALALKILSRGVRLHRQDLLLWEALAETHRLGKSDREIVEAEYQTFKRYQRSAPERILARGAWSTFGQLLNDVASFDLAREAYMAERLISIRTTHGHSIAYQPYWEDGSNSSKRLKLWRFAASPLIPTTDGLGTISGTFIRCIYNEFPMLLRHTAVR